MISSTDYIEDEAYGQCLLISVNADQRELLSNIRAARAILHSFTDITIIINAHTMSFGHFCQWNDYCMLCGFQWRSSSCKC